MKSMFKLACTVVVFSSILTDIEGMDQSNTYTGEKEFSNSSYVNIGKHPSTKRGRVRGRGGKFQNNSRYVSVPKPTDTRKQEPSNSNNVIVFKPTDTRKQEPGNLNNIIVPEPIDTCEQELNIDNYMSNFTRKYKDDITVTKLPISPEEERKHNIKGPILAIATENKQKGDEIKADIEELPNGMKKKIFLEVNNSLEAVFDLPLLCFLTGSVSSDNYTSNWKLVNFSEQKMQNYQKKIDGLKNKEVFRYLEFNMRPIRNQTLTFESFKQCILLYAAKLNPRVNYKITVKIQNAKLDKYKEVLIYLFGLDEKLYEQDKNGNFVFKIKANTPTLNENIAFGKWMFCNMSQEKHNKISRDLTRFVVLTNYFTSKRHDQLYEEIDKLFDHEHKSTICELFGDETDVTICGFFDFEMPCQHLFGWAKFMLDLDGREIYALLLQLNYMQVICLSKHSDQTLRDVCASHIMEIHCISYFKDTLPNKNKISSDPEDKI